MKRLNVFAILFFALSSLSAQVSSTSGLTQAEIEDFHNEASAQIERLQKNLELLGNRNESNTTKRLVHDETLKLFIERGQPYVDNLGNRQPAVIMQVSDVRTGRITDRTIDQYLRNLRNLAYAQVEITKAETHRISDLRKVGNNRYEAAATIYQRFIARDAEGRITISDHTEKTIQIIIRTEVDAWGEKWVVLLGNISVSETRPL